jgi:hypothetical protein
MLVHQLLHPPRMPKRDLPNFTLFGRIIVGAVALLMVLWLLRLSGIV